MSGKFLPLFINAVITFSSAIAPLFVASIVFLDSEKRTPRRIAKRLLFLGVVVNVFFLLLFSLYRQTSITSAFLYLCDGIHVKFLLATFVFDVCIIGVMKYVGGGIRPGKIYISKLILTILFVPIFLVVGSLRFREIYDIVPVEQLIFHILMSGAGANFSMVYKVVIKTLVDSIITFALLAVFLSLNITFRTQQKTVCFNISRKYQRIGAALFCVTGIALFFVNMGFPVYITSRNREASAFYETYYIDPNTVEVTFPERKRNLIVIYVESLETGFLTQKDGGAFSETLLPGIESLMKDNINFSASGGPGGAHELYGTEWTVAGIIAQYSGVPLAVSFLNMYGRWNNYEILGAEFLSGASGIGDILHNAGYKNYFILGSAIEFGGRDKYFTTHKDTAIYDYHYFIENNYLPQDYYTWWGFEDRKLYAFAKEKITEIASDEPFFITLLTADTHPSDGYLDENAAEPFDSQYKNVLFDADTLLSDFLHWLSSQSFYENTTVAVLGDHLYQDSSFFPSDFQIHSLSGGYEASYYQGNLENKYKRFPVNIFINSLLSPEYSKNRIFSHFDLFPTLIDSIGGVYDAPGLALGRSMNKGVKTLPEALGVDHVNEALWQRSEYYNKLWTGGKND